MFAGLNVKGTTDPEILQQLSADSKKEQEDKDKERETKHTKPQKQHPRVALPTRGRASRPTSVRSRRPLAAPQHAAHAISGTSGSKGLFEGLTVLKPQGDKRGRSTSIERREEPYVNRKGVQFVSPKAAADCQPLPSPTASPPSAKKADREGPSTSSARVVNVDDDGVQFMLSDEEDGEGVQTLLVDDDVEVLGLKAKARAESHDEDDDNGDEHGENANNSAFGFIESIQGDKVDSEDEDDEENDCQDDNEMSGYVTDEDDSVEGSDVDADDDLLDDDDDMMRLFAPVSHDSPTKKKRKRQNRKTEERKALGKASRKASVPPRDKERVVETAMQIESLHGASQEYTVEDELADALGADEGGMKTLRERLSAVSGQLTAKVQERRSLCIDLREKKSLSSRLRKGLRRAEMEMISASAASSGREALKLMEKELFEAEEVERRASLNLLLWEKEIASLRQERMGLLKSLNDGLNRMKSAVSNVYVRVRDRRTENISKLSAEIRVLEKQHQSETESVERMETNMSEDAAVVSAREQKFRDALDRSLESFVQERRRLVTGRGEKTAEIDRLMAEVRALQAEAAKLSDQIAAIDESIGQVKSGFCSEEEAIRLEREELNRRSETIAAHNKSCDRLKKALIDERERAEKEKSALEEESSFLDSEGAVIGRWYDKMAAEMQREERIEEIRKQVSEMEQERATASHLLVESKEQKQRQVEDCTTQLMALQKEQASCRAVAAAEREALPGLERAKSIAIGAGRYREAGQLVQEIKERKQRKEEHERRLQKLEEDEVLLRQELEQKEATLADVVERVEECMHEHDEARVAEFSRLLKQLQSEITECLAQEEWEYAELLQAEFDDTNASLSTICKKNGWSMPEVAAPQQSVPPCTTGVLDSGGGEEERDESAAEDNSAVSLPSLASLSAKQAESTLHQDDDIATRLREYQARVTLLEKEIEECLMREDYDGAQDREDERKAVSARILRVQAAVRKRGAQTDPDTTPATVTKKGKEQVAGTDEDAISSDETQNDESNDRTHNERKDVETREGFVDTEEMDHPEERHGAES